MKTIKLIGFFIIIGIFSSCDKGDELAPIPENNPTGNYNYTGHSKYFHSTGTLDYQTDISGSANIQYGQTGNTIDIYVIPMIGYEYQIKGTNLKQHGDTTTFSIGRQQVTILARTFTFEGTNGVSVGNLGNYDGYFTTKSFHLQYHSVNLGDLTTTDTYIDAIKRN